MSVTIKSVRVYSDKEWADRIFGSGALDYPWWGSLTDTGRVLGGGKVYRMETVDPDTGEEGDAYQFTLYDLATAATRMCDSVSGLVPLQMAKDDLDADGADQILQMALFGEVRYG